jgi:hypothetical protein
MKLNYKIITSVAACLVLVACEEAKKDTQKAVEKAGEGVENVAEEANAAAKETAKGVIKDTGATVDAAGEAVKTGAKEVNEAAKETAEDAGAAADAVGHGIENAADDAQNAVK